MALSDIEFNVLRQRLQQKKESQASSTEAVPAPADSQQSLVGSYLNPFGQKNIDRLKDIPNDVSSFFNNSANIIGDQLDKNQVTKERIATGETTPLAGTGEIIGGGLKAGAGVVGEAFTGLAKLFTTQEEENTIKNLMGTATEALAGTRPVQEIKSQYDSLTPQQQRNVQSFIGTAEGIGTMFGAKPVFDVLRKSLGGAIELTGTGIANTAVSGVKNVADTALESGANLRKNIQTYVSGKNVNPQLKTSVERLTGESAPVTPGVAGTASRLTDPVATYDSYLNQSKKALTDLHVDPAISEVGSKIGDAFNIVVKQRQTVGKTIGEELKTVGKERVTVTEPRTTLFGQLKDSGLAYNPKTKQLTSFTGSKFAPEEVKMLQNYVDGFNKLGDNPTVSQIDNFISQKRTELEFAKGASGVTGTTNAERIIKGNLAGLRETLNPAKNGNKKLANYWKANDTYSQLSDFLEEGQQYLGKVTQSGDYAKDASIAKSSVQSILNGGKKDWLIKLEGLTGYQALDHSVLALQAMKDAGDFRGTSLLQLLSEGAVPTSKAGFTAKAIDYAMQKGTQAVAGSPEEQTRAFLNALKQQSQSTSPQIK